MPLTPVKFVKGTLFITVNNATLSKSLLHVILYHFYTHAHDKQRASPLVCVLVFWKSPPFSFLLSFLTTADSSSLSSGKVHIMQQWKFVENIKQSSVTYITGPFFFSQFTS